MVKVLLEGFVCVCVCVNITMYSAGLLPCRTPKDTYLIGTLGSLVVGTHDTHQRR